MKPIASFGEVLIDLLSIDSKIISLTPEALRPTLPPQPHYSAFQAIS